MMNITTINIRKDEKDIECGQLYTENFDKYLKNDPSKLSEVRQFFEKKNVLVTGASGFLGKVLLEKLLRCCSSLENLYILVRPKRGKVVNSRIDEIFEDPIFDRLKKEVPNFIYKVVGIQGDCESINLGLSMCDRVVLQKNIDIIFHSAATVKFNEHLRYALAINVRATLLLLDIAKDMEHLKCFMHISTAFSNPFLNCIDEKFYPTNVVYEVLQKKVDILTDEQINDQMSNLMCSEWPNTYTFTKALTENELLRRSGREVPLCIFRPSIVTSTAREPIRGWVNNMYGPIGLVASCATGVLRTLPCDPSATAEIVPVDYVVNCLLVASLNVHRLYSHSPPNEPPIFNFVTSPENSLTWRTFKSSSFKKLHIYPSSNSMWYNVFVFNKNWYVYQICVFLLHLLPALVMDGFTLCLGRKPRMLKICAKVQNFSSAIRYFTTKSFNFKDQRTRELWEATSVLDKQLFPFDMRTLDWDDYFDDVLLGVRRYLLKESDETLPQARVKWMRLYYLHQTVCFAFISCALYVIVASVLGVM